MLEANHEGIFTFNEGEANEHSIKNTLVADGASFFLQLLFQAVATLPAGYYIGLTNSAYAFDTCTLASLAAGEPAGNGYARQLATRNNTDWTVSEVNGIYQAKSKTLTFAATGNYDKLYSRAFICNLSAGTGGNVLAVSGAEPVPVQVLNGAGLKISYTFRLRR